MWDLLEPLAGFHHIKFDASKDGGKWAFVNMVTKEAAEYVIKELNGYEMKGREIEGEILAQFLPVLTCVPLCSEVGRGGDVALRRSKLHQEKL